jgi:hypothetical protein
MAKPRPSWRLRQQWNVRSANRRRKGTGLPKDNVAKDKVLKGHAAKVEDQEVAIAGARTVDARVGVKAAAIEVTIGVAIARVSMARLKSTSRN